MTQRKNFLDLRWRLAAAIAAICLAPGCATSTTGDAAPTAAMPAAQAPAIAAAETTPSVVSEVQLSSGAPRNTGTFPNLNIPPQAAAKQISAQQKAARLAELRAARTGQTAPPGSAGTSASKARLKKLASSHATEALKEIENN
ncbi:hypothetical protein [Mesorhizobium sp. WSM2239]|jgi:hypothetical protein|uniref:Uncharacterized protein n=2 Tax=unclassified Mesorhizobium TaxID=325217 RepID=A0AAU8D1T2_9HYPH